jgi:hypothetical protein
MSHYSGVEKKIAAYLSRFPLLKSILKRAYQYINYLVYRPGYKAKSDYPIEEVGAGASKSTFFGYYDKSPRHPDNDYLLMHAFNGSTTRLPSKTDRVQILALEKETEEVACKFTSGAFNWQQGSRLQWVDEDSFVYNDLSESGSRYVARKVSVRAKDDVRVYERAIQDGWQDEYFISLNYRRLSALRPDYGYFSIPPLDDSDIKNLRDDGLWYVDYDSGKDTLLYSLDQMCQVKPDVNLEGSLHYANHVMISPSGNRFVFLHRYLSDGIRFDRLMLGTPDGDPLQVLADHEMVSHYCWIDNRTIIGYMRGPDNKDGYHIVDVEDGTMTSALDGQLDKYGDGHPHVNSSTMVTDTYPNKGRMQTLLRCDLKSQSVKEIAEVHHGLRYDAQTRCDLHPRLDPNGDIVYFDSVYNGKRRLKAMHVR